MMKQPSKSLDPNALEEALDRAGNAVAKALTASIDDPRRHAGIRRYAVQAYLQGLALAGLRVADLAAAQQQGAPK